MSEHVMRCSACEASLSAGQAADVGRLLGSLKRDPRLLLLNALYPQPPSMLCPACFNAAISIVKSAVRGGEVMVAEFPPDSSIVARLGPRGRRILLYLLNHPEWERNADLEAIRFRILDRGRDANRITFKLETRETLEDVP